MDATRLFTVVKPVISIHTFLHWIAVQTTMSLSIKENTISSFFPGSHSDNLIDRVHYWIPPVTPFQTQKKQPNSSLRMAAIVDDRLYRGLRYEGNLLLLTPENYHHVIQDEKPDIILVESCRQSVSGHWRFAQIAQNHEREALLRLIDLARQNNIPVIYWFTADHSYHDHYQEILPFFDHIFCADPLELELLKGQMNNVSLLPPAIQPVIHNPFRDYQNNNHLAIDTIFDGWADLLRFDNLLPMKRLSFFGLKVIDSRNLIFRDKLKDIPDHHSHILGCVHWQDRLTALKHSNVAISCENSLASLTLQKWHSLETLGCRVPLVHFGKIGDGDIRKGLVVETGGETDFLTALARIIEEPTYREQLAQLKWREVHQHHTFSQRLRSLCEKIGVHYPAIESPMATLLSPTNRPDHIGQILGTYEKQTVPNKELIIIYNGPNSRLNEVQQTVLKTHLEGVRLLTQPAELYAGASLNNGAQNARGQYCFRIDDDDYYSEHYIADMMLHFQAIDVDIFGKPPCHLYFEDDEELYSRNSPAPQLCKFPATVLHSGDVWLGGNSIAGKTDIFRRFGYPDTVFGSADTSFLFEISRHDLQFYSVDQNNLVASRREEGSHTWKSDNETLKQRGNLLAGVTIDDYNGYKLVERTDTRKRDHTRQVVLFLGPVAFRDGVWQNRVKYIFPDLFEQLYSQADLFMLTGPVPEFAREGMASLSKKYGITWKELPSKPSQVSQYSWWIAKGMSYAEEIQADVLTNIFAGLLFGYAMVRIADRLGIKTVIRMAGDDIESKLAMDVYVHGSDQHLSDYRKEFIAFNSADTVIVMSELEKKRVCSKCSHKSKVEVCYRGVDLDTFSPVHSPGHHRVNKFLFVGRKSPEKGYDLVENAAKRMALTHPEIVFMFAGTFEKETIENRQYLGFIDTEKLPELYEGADALILSSRTEGMPQVVLEAMAQGTPCILSRHLFASQLIEGQEALFVELNSDDLVRKIILLHDDQELADRLAVNGRRYAEENFKNTFRSQQYAELVLGKKVF